MVGCWSGTVGRVPSPAGPVLLIAADAAWTTGVRLARAVVFFALAAYWLGLARGWDWAVRRRVPSRVSPLPLALLALFLGLLNLVLALT